MSTDTRFDLSLDPRGLSRTGLSVWPDTRGHGHRVSVHRTAPARRGSHRAAGGRGAHAGASGRDIQEPTSQRQLFWPMRAAGRMFTRNCACRMIMICESRRRKRKNGTAPAHRPEGLRAETAPRIACHGALVQHFIPKVGAAVVGIDKVGGHLYFAPLGRPTRTSLAFGPESRGTGFRLSPLVIRRG